MSEFMKNHLSIVCAAMCAVIFADCVSGTAVNRDPELFENASANKNRYAGVMPAGVRRSEIGGR